jgi:mono/diheme cytochrome c family protein
MKTFLYFLLALIFVACNNPSSSNNNNNAAAPVTDGKQLFSINCAQCHRPNEDFTGPALKGVQSRWKDAQTLYAFVRNSQEVIKRDAYAKALFDHWKQTYMQPFPQLNDEQIKAILDYCDSAEK